MRSLCKRKLYTLKSKMKIISFGDVHEDVRNLIPLKDELESADAIIISGDLTNYHGKNEASKVIDETMKYNKNVFAQYGNLDNHDVDDYLSDKGINLHRNGHTLDDIGIFGVGGSNKTPFNTPTEFSEDELGAFLLEAYEKVKDARFKIMIPHVPPKDTKTDVIGNGVHVGSQSVRDFIIKYNPDIVICGHIHEAKTTDKIGNTLILNAGMFREGGYITVEKEAGNLTGKLKILS